MNPLIVVLAYNRPAALQRLLDSVAAAEYHGRPTLIISLEGGATPAVVSVAKRFDPEALEVRVVERNRKLGLRDHVISCADLSLEYGSVIILEDDLIVDRYFYYYASQALQFYESQSAVCGVSLYAYEYNQFCGLPFRPMRNGYSSYPMQLACSWGQCWTRAQWVKFKTWYAGKQSSDLYAIEGLPLAVKKWPETSWKKYFHGYMVETDRYFIYPYSTLSTNCSDSGGTHVRTHSNLYQTCLATPQRPLPNIRFSPAGNREVVYDAYMEPVGDYVYRALGLDRTEVDIDFQGIKPLNVLKKKAYVLTARNCAQFHLAYAFAFRPPEVNLMFPASSNEKVFWCLAPASALLADRVSASMEWFNYFSGMRLMRKDFERVFIWALFKRAGRNIRRFLKVPK